MKTYKVAIGFATIAMFTLTGCSTTSNTVNSSKIVDTTTNINHSQQISSPKSSLTHLTWEDYLGAVNTMDRFLNDWLNYDSSVGIPLLTPHANQDKNLDQLKEYFEHTNSSHAGYEIVGYKKVGSNEFEFHVWMYGYAMGLYGANTWSRPQPETVTVVYQNNSWYIDNLPRY